MTTTSHRYGAGLPRVGTRALVPHEVVAVRKAQRGAWAWLLACAAGLMLAAALGLLLPQPYGVVASLAGLATVVTLALAPLSVRLALLGALLVQGAFLFVSTTMPESRPPHPWLVGTARLATVAVSTGFIANRLVAALALVRRRGALALDLDDATVERCAGRLRALSDVRAFRVLRRRGEVVDAGQTHEIDVLPRSGFVLRVDGRVPSRPVLASTVSVAPTVPHAMRVALPPDLSAIASSTVELQRRSLTPAELDELRRHATAMRRPPAYVFGLFPLALATALLQWFGLVPTSGGALMIAAAVYLTAGAAGLHTVQRLRTAARLRADENLRWLVTVTERDAPSGAPPHLEMLPVSRLAWTDGAAPSPWRVD